MRHQPTRPGGHVIKDLTWHLCFANQEEARCHRSCGGGAEACPLDDLGNCFEIAPRILRKPGGLGANLGVQVHRLHGHDRKGAKTVGKALVKLAMVAANMPQAFQRCPLAPKGYINVVPKAEHIVFPSCEDLEARPVSHAGKCIMIQLPSHRRRAMSEPQTHARKTCAVSTTYASFAETKATV